MAVKLNRSQRRELDVLIKIRQKGVIEALTDEKLELWKQAQHNCQWLVGDPIKMSDGTEVDFSMFDFALATTKFTPEDQQSDLKKFQRFWTTLWPYLDNVITNLNHYKLKFREIYGIEGQTLKKFALQNLELKCYQQFFKDELKKELVGGQLEAEPIIAAFKKYHLDFKAESDAEIAKIKIREDKWMAEQEAKQEKREQEQKTAAFGASLM